MTEEAQSASRPRTVVKSVRISPELWGFVEERARVRSVSANAWLVKCIEDTRARLQRGSAGPGA